MKIAIIYKSLTGNTKLLADTIKDYYQDQVIYCGEVKEDIDADLYFIGSWVDKGMCSKEIAAYLPTLQNKKIAYFATAGFGGSKQYYDDLWKRTESLISSTNTVLGHFYCQGKMPMSVRNRYVQMIQAHPDDKKLEVSIQNFDHALTHPDKDDLDNLRNWLEEMK